MTRGTGGDAREVCDLRVRRRGGFPAGCLLGLGACALPAAIAAQESGASLAVGAAQVRFADEPAFTSLTLSPALTWRGAAGSLALSATVAQVGASGWSQQGVATGSLFSPVTRQRLMVEATGAAGGTRYPGGFATGQGVLGARAHHVGDRVSVWIGAFAGGLNDGAAWRRVRQTELGVAGAWRYHRAALVASPSAVSETLHYTDVLFSYGTSRGPWDVTLSLGARGGEVPNLVGGDQRLWGGANLQLWLAPRSALQVGVGTYPVDVTQGFPAGRYVSVGLRVGARRSIAAQSQADAWATRGMAAEHGVRRFDVSRGDDGTVAIAVQVDGARSVELSGDLTRWAPMALVRGSDGRWWGRFPDPGMTVVEVTLRVDAGAWIVPPGTDAARDEFGGVSGRLVLPARR